MSKPHLVSTPEQMAQTTALMAQLSPDELAQLTDRMRTAGRTLADTTPDEIADWVDQLHPAERPSSDSPEDWADLKEFLDDTLLLRYQGSQYRLQAADIDTGLECQMLLGVGARMRAGGKPTQRQRDRLEDAEETELFVRLLGGQRWKVEPEDSHCPVCDADTGEPCSTEDTELDEPHEGRGTPDPHYRPEHDVWRQLDSEGRSWAFVQHVGTTAIFWAAFGSAVALEYWQSGGRPKAAPAPAAPAPKVPQDRQVSTAATSTPPQGSGNSSPQSRQRKATRGRPS